MSVREAPQPGAVSDCFRAEIPPPRAILRSLRPGHPRLLAQPADFDRVKRLAASDPYARRWRRHVKLIADELIGTPPVECGEVRGARLQHIGRAVADRVYHLALMYQITGDTRYADRAYGELSVLMNLKAWPTWHFLGTAESMHALAMGYDWLYHALSEAQRSGIRDAVIEKGLRPALEIYEGKRGLPHSWFTTVTHNWSQVCNGSSALAALAFAEDEPELASKVLHHALTRLPAAMAHYAPDGGYPEGPTIWSYGTRFNVYVLAALESALGTDFGLHRAPGFVETPLYPIHLHGPSGQTCTFQDSPPHAHPNLVREPAIMWFAHRFGRPAYVPYQRGLTAGEPLDLLWYRPRRHGAQAAPLPLDSYFRHVETVTMRSAWDGQALFAGFKAGNNRFNHAHLDLGSFVCDALGKRWALDFGPDRYDLPGFWDRRWDGGRWKVYRLRAEGHNTLVLNPGQGPDQDPEAAARIVKFASRRAAAFAVADLTPAYVPHAAKVQRGIALFRRPMGLLVQDEVHAARPADVWWFMHTRARIALANDGRTAILRQGQARLAVEIVEPGSCAAFQARPARPLPGGPDVEGQDPNEGVTKLAIHLPRRSKVRLVVRLVPLPTGQRVRRRWPAIRPLQEWE